VGGGKHSRGDRIGHVFDVQINKARVLNQLLVA
jgi:hypothetical protein